MRSSDQRLGAHVDLLNGGERAEAHAHRALSGRAESLVHKRRAVSARTRANAPLGRQIVGDHGGIEVAHVKRHDAGAPRVTPAAVQLDGGNVRQRSFEARCQRRLVRGDVLKRGAAAPGRPFDLVFLDPPYATDPAEILGLLGRLGDAGALARDLIVSYEHDASDDDAVEALAETSGYEIASRRHFGDTTLDLLERLCTE